MKMAKFNEMTVAELNKKLNELKEELFYLRLKHAAGQLSNPMAIATTKKDIARVKTIIRQRELSATQN